MARLLCMDITGTLVRGSVGGHYGAAFFEEAGGALDYKLSQAFKQAFRLVSAEYPCFGARQGLSSMAWWHKVVKQSVLACDPSYPESKFEPAFSNVYALFGTPTCWELTPGADKALEAVHTWRERGGVTAVLTNFDERVLTLLDVFGLSKSFDVIAYSAHIKAEKPEPAAFNFVRNHPAIRLAPEQCLHVGDSADHDVRGALAAGWSAVGVGARARIDSPPSRMAWIPSISDLPDVASKAFGANKRSS